MCGTRTQQWQDLPEAEDWGELHLRAATPDAGSEWTDDGSPRDQRQLKHRAEGDSRIVPTHPELTRLLRDHLAEFGTAPDGRLFSGVRGGELPTITYRRAWIKARQVALTAAEQASPLARRPYDLRHACLSTWLNGGVYPTQVAEWAGHGVDVLLGSTPSASRARTSSPSAGSPKRCARTEARFWARIGHSQPQITAWGRTQPPMTQNYKITRARHFRSSQAIT